MFKKVSGMIGSITMSVFATVTPSIVSADQIALTFEQHGMTIAGDYVGFQDNAYVIITTAGTIYVPAILVSCEGVDCLDIVFPTRQDS